MGDVVKWGILLAAGLLIIGAFLAFPIMEYFDVTIYAQGIAMVVNIAGDYLIFARGLINNFFSPWARKALSGLMIWLIGKWMLTYSVRIVVWIYHYLFK